MSKIITSNDCPVDAGGWYHDLEAKYGYFVSFSGLSLRTKTSQSMSKCLNSWKVHRQTPDMGSREIRGLNGEGFWRRTLFYFQRLCRLCLLTIFSLSSHYLLTHYLLTIFSLFLVKVVATLQSCPRNAGHVRLVQEPPQVRSPKMLGDQFLLIKFNQIHIIYIYI